MHKIWKRRTKPNATNISILGDFGNNPIVASLLSSRNIKTHEEAEHFFHPSTNNLHDPFLMKDMQKAITRIEEAMRQNQKILLFGDYDVDGTTAVSMMWLFFQNQLKYKHVGYYIPDRYTEGYGVSEKSIDWAHENQYQLIISLDCGIKSSDKVSKATEKGIDFIICDHHLPDANIPKAIAILNPKQSDCPYPFKELSGCGVAFKLIQAICQKHNQPENAFTYLDLVAVSTCCDIVPITHENRILVYHGLKKLNQNPCPGIASIINQAQSNHDFSVEDVVFFIGPRINAAGRIKHGNGAVDLLIASEQNQTTQDLTSQLNTHNTTRKGLDRQMTEHALQMISDNASWFNNASSTVLFCPEWHKGVVGIVASRIIESHYKPTIILTESNGKATGSARSVRDFDIHAAISRCAHLLDNFGGHMHAAGLTMPLENVEEFRQTFDKIVNETWPPFLRKPIVYIDEEIELHQITSTMFDAIQLFAPFGPGNMDPVFVTRNLNASKWTKIVGDNHLKLYVSPAGKSAPSFAGIAFKQGHHIKSLLQGASFHLAYNLRINEWNGKKNIELDVKDIRFDDIGSIE
ncbi:MAG: single-stranded-DNA-specific exonuclease RecJ [Candidatus Competibacteraceae bacterium]|nr:single-stranded-DNA-specific exonuclease RecJ [Candidatus Competibacteraceae bacterium]